MTGWPTLGLLFFVPFNLCFLKWPNSYILSYRGSNSFLLLLLPYFFRLFPYCPLASLSLGLCYPSTREPPCSDQHLSAQNPDYGKGQVSFPWRMKNRDGPFLRRNNLPCQALFSSASWFSTLNTASLSQNVQDLPSPEYEIHRIKNTKYVQDQIKEHSCCDLSSRQVCFRGMDFQREENKTTGKSWPYCDRKCRGISSAAVDSCRSPILSPLRDSSTL